jgi:LysM repeat protein
MWTKSACVVLAWSILMIILVAVGMTRSARPAQANVRIASNTVVSLTSTLSVAAASVTPARPVATYVVQPGDTLSGIAARFAVRGGWPTLYAANRLLIGPDPNLIHSGTVLRLPNQTTPIRYEVMAGDTLAGIAAAFSVRGGWPTLYAANRPLIGHDPNMIRPGTVLTVPGLTRPLPTASRPGHRLYPIPPPSRAGSRYRPRPARIRVATITGMPKWLKTMLLSVGLLIGVALLTESALVVARRGRQQVATGAARPCAADADRARDCERLASGKAHIVLADHDRLIVTRSTLDGTVCVLRPPGEDPKEILRVARLVLPEDPYRELAKQLGMPASWPIVVADHDRLIVTHSKRDDMAYVLRPPGEDPKAILRAARLVLPEDPYEELADQLGVPAGWPME